MKNLTSALVVIAAASLLVGIISRLMVEPVLSLEANAFLRFTNTCLFFAIALTLIKQKS